MFTALVPVFGAFVGCGAGVILIFLEDPVKALVFLILFLVLQEIEGRPYLSPCGGKFCRPAADLGTGGGERRGEVLWE